MVYWWVMCDHDFHVIFSKDKDGYKDDEEPFEEAFYDFTTKYSVSRSVINMKSHSGKSEKGETAKNRLLQHIYSKGDISTCLPIYLDELNNRFRENNRKKSKKEKSVGVSVLSLLSKFATLVNPSKFSMMDRNAKWSLKQLGYTEKVNISSYKEFHEGFESYYKEFNDLVYNDSNDDNIYFYKLLEKIIDNKEDMIDIDVFQRRVADKYLWHYYNTKYPKGS